MDALEPDELYEERNSVSYARPLLQGDVFDDVAVPGLGDAPLTVQIVMHPCSMRRGTELVERVQVAPVVNYQKVGNWNGHKRVMPLPDLYDDGQHYAAKFADATAVPALFLTADKRRASLTQKGILVLQQRIVMDHARLDLALGLFREQSAPVLAEAEMQEAWVETALQGNEMRDTDAVVCAAANFQGWLDEDEGKRRTELRDEANHAGLRKAVRQAASAQHEAAGR